MFGNVVTGYERIVFFPREARNGTLSVMQKPVAQKDDSSIHGFDGNSGGEIVGSVAKFPSSLMVDLSGRSGGNGTSGDNGNDGRNGKCGAFSYKGNRPDGNGSAGRNAGNGGDGGSIDLWYAIGPVTPSQVPVTGGNPGVPGAGGQGGRGGDGCVGPGGSQGRDKDGLNGGDGKSGVNG